MNRLIRAIIAVIFIAIITFSAISIFQNIKRPLRIDITDRKIYTLSDGTRNILAGLNQTLKVKLYYTKTAAMKATDQIKYFNNYYHFVRALLEEYASEAKGMIDLQIIDPLPFSNEEVEAIRYGLKRFPISEEENFFFGMVIQTPFGVEKTIEFFSPDRQSFVEYDISYLIDTAITRQKKRIGIVSSLPVAGDDVSGYMRQMMIMQGQQPKPAWGIVQHLKQMYEVSDLGTDVEEIKNVDILMVIHPKNLSERTMFAIDQFVLSGGRALIFVDPFSVSDQPSQQQFGAPHDASSSINKLLNAWGLDMAANTFAGDRSLATMATLRARSRPERILGVMNLDKQCFNSTNAVTADLNKVNLMFSGVLNEVKTEASETKLTPLLSTTNRGNSWTVMNQSELMGDMAGQYRRFVDGTKPVTMAYIVTGKFHSAFPNGIVIPDESADTETDKPATKTITGLTVAAEDCAVAVFADVDLISDTVAYRRSIFGMSVVDDNSSLVLNTIEDLSGSSNLMSIRARGSFKRPFVVVDAIEIEAEAETAAEEEKLVAQVTALQQRLQEKVAAARGKGDLIKDVILNERRAIELEIRQAEQQLRKAKLKKRRRIDQLGVKLRNFCTLPGPAIILVIAIILAVRRSMLRRYYIRHTTES
ncbi:MAG TPA: hypothetical protein ENH94_05470 [Phycisphaerales bacterium]|nr:hypothetical protein [Phycisphaerales bacterium]